MRIAVVELLLLALLCAACVGSALYVTDTMSQTQTHLEEAMSCMEADLYQSAGEQMQQVISHWDRHKTLFGTVLRHDEVDRVMAEFQRLQFYVQSEQTREFLGNCTILLAQLKQMQDMEWPSFENVM